MKNYKGYSEKLVLKVNELYSDFIHENYHPLEIFEQEKERWERIAKQFLNFIKPITIVDIGTGTGFVPLTIAKFLKKDDTFICADISKGILDIAKKNIDKHDFQCKFKFVKIDSTPFKLPFDKESIDIITINSVLHHINDTNTFISEVDAILKLKGLFFIAHEPNMYFHKNNFLRFNYLFMHLFINPKITLYKILRMMQLGKMINEIYIVAPTERKNILINKQILNKINRVLLEEKFIKKPLLTGEIDEIRDIKAREGFKPDLILPNYELLYLETYHHMHYISINHYNNFIIKKYENMLRRKYPYDGSIFFMVLKKKLKNN